MQDLTLAINEQVISKPWLQQFITIDLPPNNAYDKQVIQTFWYD